jgi:hypothetical protein
MDTLTKHSLPFFVDKALHEAGFDPSDFGDLALQMLMTCSIEFDDETPVEDLGFNSFIVLNGKSGTGSMTDGRHLNIYALASLVLGAATTFDAKAQSCLALLLALLGACTVSLSPEQAAFFLATRELEKSNTVPTAKALANAIGRHLGQPNFNVAFLLVIVSELQKLGAQITVGQPPNQVVRHKEISFSIPLA